MVGRREIDEAIAQGNDRMAPRPDGVKTSAIRATWKLVSAPSPLESLLKAVSTIVFTLNLAYQLYEGSPEAKEARLRHSQGLPFFSTVRER